MAQTLKDRTAIVTGANSGIGFAVAQKLASEGCAIIFIARRGNELSKAATRVKKQWNVPTAWYSVDVTEGKELQALQILIKKDFGFVDFLVNNAGGSHVTSLEDKFDDAFVQDLELNLRSTHLCCRLLSTSIKKGGAIVNISSLNGQVVTTTKQGKTSPRMGYAAAKAGVIQLTRLYAVQLAKQGIRVNAVAPGGIYPTGMTGDWNEQKQRAAAKETPLGRLGTTLDVANAVYFLASDLSSFITGHTLNVNGGKFMN